MSNNLDENGRYHSYDDQPILLGRVKYWYKNGNYHRENGPAVIYPDNDAEYWLNGKFHRHKGPALDFPVDGRFEWYIHGQKHRFNAPAYIGVVSKLKIYYEYNMETKRI